MGSVPSRQEQLSLSHVTSNTSANHRINEANLEDTISNNQEHEIEYLYEEIESDDGSESRSLNINRFTAYYDCESGNLLNSSSSTTSYPVDNNINTSSYYCNICLQQKSMQFGVSITKCVSIHTFCRECMNTYFMSKIKDRITQIPCPQDKCTAVADCNDVSDIVTHEYYQRFQRFVSMKINPDYRECSACKKEISYDKLFVTNKLICPCGHVSCYIHGDAHSTESCQQYQDRMSKQENLSVKIIETISRKCPSCKANTEKNGGCNHMRCSRCSASWCWICGKIVTSTSHHYSNGSLATRNRCQQFSPAVAVVTAPPPVNFWRCVRNCAACSINTDCLCDGFVDGVLCLEGLLYGVVAIILILIGSIVYLIFYVAMVILDGIQVCIMGGSFLERESLSSCCLISSLLLPLLILCSITCFWCVCVTILVILIQCIRPRSNFLEGIYQPDGLERSLFFRPFFEIRQRIQNAVSSLDDCNWNCFDGGLN